MTPELQNINDAYEHDFVSPSREEKIQAAMALIALGYEMEHAFISSTAFAEGTVSSGDRLIQTELDKWQQDGHDGVAGPYVDMRGEGEDPFVPKAGIAYWIKRDDS